MAESAILASIEAAAAADDSGWSATARSTELVELLRAQERLAALVQRKVGAWDRDQCWAADDALSPVSWLLYRVPLTRQDAMVLVRTARHVVQHEATAKALDAGDIAAAHTTVIGREVRHRESLYPEHEDVILDAARQISSTSPPPLAGSGTSKGASTRSASRRSRRCSTRWSLPTRRTRPSAATCRSGVPTR